MHAIFKDRNNFKLLKQYETALLRAIAKMHPASIRLSRSAWKGILHSTMSGYANASRTTADNNARPVLHLLPSTRCSSEGRSTQAWHWKYSSHLNHQQEHNCSAEFCRVRLARLRRHFVLQCIHRTSWFRLRMLVHNGKSYITVNITPEMVGHKVC